MFKFTDNDLDKMVKGLGYLMDNSSPLFLKKGHKQNFLRLEMAETDDGGNPVVNFSGVEFTLDHEVTEDIFLLNGLSFLSKLRSLNEPSINVIECDDGSVELEVTDNDNFTFNVGLSDPETIFMEYGGNQDFINSHKQHLKHGITTLLEQNNFEVVELFLSLNDIDKIKKFNVGEEVNFVISNNKATVSNTDKNSNDRYKFVFQENLPIDNELFWNIQTNRLNKLHKSDYKMSIYYKNDDVQSVTMKSTDNGLTYILPLV